MIAKEYKKLGLNPIPLIPGEKFPSIKNWGESIPEDALENNDFKHIGVCTGIVSGGLEALDFDLKNAENPAKFMEDWSARIPADILEKLVVQKTPSGGYHMLYRCEAIDRNRKLCRNEEGLAIIETRGEGGYIKIAPSPKYEFVRGDAKSIKIITAEERNTLFATSIMMDEKPKKIYHGRGEFQDRFPQYNEDPEIGIKILEDHGWTHFRDSGEWSQFTRPGKDTGVSGAYNMESNFFYVFTSSTELEQEKCYSNSALFCELEHEGDYKAGYKELFEAGYGVEDDEENPVGDEMEFLSDNKDSDKYLKDVLEGNLKQGMKTGWTSLDKYLRVTPNTLNFFLGYEGTGKTLFLMHFAAMLHYRLGFKIAIASPENDPGQIKRKLIEAMSGKNLEWLAKDMDKYRYYKKIVDDNFFIINNREHWSITQVLKMGEKLWQKHKIDALFIEPINYFKVEGPEYSYMNRVLSEMRVFNKNFCSIYAASHPYTDAGRNGSGKDGYLEAPNRYSILGGSNTVYRTDNFYINHRIKNHTSEVMRRTMQFITGKVKNEEEGATVHSNGEWTELEYCVRKGHLGYWDENDTNPFYKEKEEFINEEPKSNLPLGNLADAF